VQAIVFSDARAAICRDDKGVCGMVEGAAHHLAIINFTICKD